MYTAFVLLIFSLGVGSALGAIGGLSVAAGDCLCVSGNNVAARNLRKSALTLRM